MPPPTSSARLSVVVPAEYRRRLVSPRAPRGALSGALLRCIEDATALYGLPKPVQAALQKDMRKRRFADQRDYVQWLLLERYRAVSLSSAPTVKPGGAR